MFYKKKIVLTEGNGKVHQVVSVTEDNGALSVSANGDKSCELALFVRDKLIICGNTPITYKLPDWSGEEVHIGILQGNNVLATGSTRGNHYSHLFTRDIEKPKEKKTSPPPTEKPEPTPEPEKQKECEEAKNESIKELEPEKPKPIEQKAQRESSNERDVHEFYCSIKQNLDEMFVCYPKEEKLCSLIEDSEWVKVDRPDGHYAVGLIKNDGAPEYICYGVPGGRDLLPPDNLKKYCQWIPLNDSDSEGYWMVFQDAKTGIALEND